MRAFLAYLPRPTLRSLQTPRSGSALGAKHQLAEFDARLIARSSPTVEFTLRVLMDGVIPVRGPTRLLEVGCGSGAYILHAAERNPDLSAVGVDLSPEVVEATREALAQRGLADRTDEHCGDIRGLPPRGDFDVVTLHNVVYYFPVDERVDIYRRLRSLLAPGGVIVTTTWCRGRSPGAAAIDLWFSLTAGCGRLPTAAELSGQMKLAGSRSVKARRLLPFEGYYAFLC